MRDPTRGGLGTICNELAQDAAVAVILDEERCRSRRWCRAPATCSASTRSTSPTRASSSRSSPPEEADAAVAALRAHPLGADAAVIGEIVAEPEGIVALRTPFGGSRIVDMLVGDPLPRIC